MSKQRKRAKRLAKYLDQKLGWEIFDNTLLCTDTSCSHIDDCGDFCKFCGSEMKEDYNNKLELLDQLEGALEYALKK